MSLTSTQPTRAPSARLMWAILALVLLADALDMIDSAVTNIAAPTIAANLHGGTTLIKWLGSAYMLAMGVLLVIGGRLGDKYGQRQMFLIGMGGFTLASAIAGLAPNPIVMIAARAAQGAFGALMIPQGMAIMTKMFPEDMLGKAFAMFGPMLGFASVGGPVLAGFIIDADLFGLSWRPIFLVNVVLGGAGLPLAARLLPRDDADRRVRVDTVGSALLSAAMLGLLYGLVEGSTSGWNATPVLSIAAGAVCFVAFARRQVTAAEPLLKPSLLGNRSFASGLAVGLVVFAAVTGLMYVLSLYLQLGLHATPRAAALGLLPMTLGIIAAAGTNLAQRLGRTSIFVGLGVVIAGGGWILALVRGDGTVGLLTLAPAMFIVGMGMGFCFGTVFNVALGDIDPDEAGSASGSLSAIQQLASAVGSAAITSVFFHTTAGGIDHATAISLIVVLALASACLPLVALMPRRAAEGLHH